MKISMESVQGYVREKATAVKQKILALSHFATGLIQALRPKADPNLPMELVEQERSQAVAAQNKTNTPKLEPRMGNVYNDINKPN